jgi:putative toxin-antitoxin system antitoxin component (TIGR02293 family)
MKQGRTSSEIEKGKKPPRLKKRRSKGFAVTKLGAVVRVVPGKGPVAGLSKRPEKKSHDVITIGHESSEAKSYVVGSDFDTETGLTALSNRIYGTAVTGAEQKQSKSFHGVTVTVKGPFVQMDTSALRALQGYSDEEIYNLVVPKRTLARRTAEKQPLSAQETDRAVRLARIGKMAEQVFGNADKAHRWLRKPKPSLQGETPLNYLASETGARVVEEMLTRIDHGILS